MMVADTSISGALRRRMTAFALSMVLFALVAYWSSLEDETRRSRTRARRPVRAARAVYPTVFVCETIPTRCHSVRLVPFRPVRHPFELN